MADECWCHRRDRPCPIHGECLCLKDPWRLNPDCPRHGDNQCKPVVTASAQTSPSITARVPWLRMEKPAVTREEYDKARAVLDRLPAGIYIHCAKCRGWYKAGAITMDDHSGVYCEGCS